MPIRLKRAYEAPDVQDGCRVLVDRLWPRGVRKEGAKIDLWLRDIAPGDELRKWFDHDPEKWEEFKRRYFAELDNKPEWVTELRKKVEEGRLTLVYAAREARCNNAAALKEYLEGSG